MRGQGADAGNSPCPGSHCQVGVAEARYAGGWDGSKEWGGGGRIQKIGRESVPEVLGAVPRNLGLAMGTTEAFK